MDTVGVSHWRDRPADPFLHVHVFSQLVAICPAIWLAEEVQYLERPN
jgi:hypothetical protein